MIRCVASVALVVAVILGSTWPTLLGKRIAFRDVNHFYLPLYDYVAERTAAQWLPLWNPLDHTGMPLIGETSTAVLYPLRWLVYSFPLASDRLSNESLISLYLIVHLLLASAAAAWLAKSIGCRRLGVLVAAIVYPLSGSVFSLCCNPPFLVGAAWIPFALGACLPTMSTAGRSRSMRRRIVIAATALAMMVLGGDPQSALHCVMTAAAISLFHARGQFRQARRQGRTWMQCEFVRTLLVGVCSGALAVGISSIQIAASLDWSRQSVRAARVAQRSEIYEFSLAPWHAVETLSPRPFGHLFPVHRRIANVIPGEGRMWTPSLYAGLVVGFALLCRLARPRSYFVDPWLAVSLVSLTICFGHFGLVWWLQQIPGVLEHGDSAVGGPFWMLCQWIPGYSSFRYPVKWLPIFAIASSMVAAQWISSDRDKVELPLALMLLVGFSGGGVLAHLASQQWERWLPIDPDAIPVDEYWGRLDVAGGLAMIRWSCGWSVAVLCALVGLRRFAGWHDQRRPAIWIGGAWVALIAIDAITNTSTLLPRVDVWRERQLAHQASPAPIARTRTLRTQAGMWPQQWRTTRSVDRPLEVAASERIAWFGRWHLAERQAVFNSMVSIKSRSYGEFWWSCNHHLQHLDREQRAAFWQAIRQWLAIGAVSHVDGHSATAADGLTLVSVQRRMTEPVRDLRVFTEWLPEKPLRELIPELVLRPGLPLPHLAAAPPTSGSVTAPVAGSVTAPTGRSARVDRAADGTILVRCDTDCVLERCVYQDGNWRAGLDSVAGDSSRSLRVFRSSHLNQAVLIPPGNWRVTFEYRPWWKGPALAVTTFAAIMLGILVVLPNQFGMATVRGIVFFLIRGRLLRSFRPYTR
ncbi:hypothetical protein Enr13x_45800 [Stieleria neptunia]|uniref:Bacterial membrane protein YfhO n=1 Tax=Stieleria neptunia TaxID=2527979 RepID=A0A518HV29_9BACT|nr:hypothetical protein [Stieleria neptunia]QDV44711.1 hypothetical protein Enr13x_45800 [Stieleria neptunia]